MPSFPVQSGRRRLAAVLASTTLGLGALACRSNETPNAMGTPGATNATNADSTAAATAEAPASATSQPTSPAAAMATERALALLPRFARQFGSQGTSDGTLQLPFCVAIDGAGIVYVGDTVGLQAFDANGTFIRRLGAGTLFGVSGVAVTPDGSTVYAADQAGSVVALGPEGDVVRTLSTSAEGSLLAPSALALAPDGDLFVSDAEAGRVVVLAPDGTVRRTIGELGQGRGQFTSPRALGFDSAGLLYVGLGDDYLIQRFDLSGAYVDSIGHTYSDETIFRVGGMAFDANARMYVTRSATHYVGVYDVADPNGRWIGDFGTVGRGPGEFNTPTGIAIHDEQLYVVDQDNHRIQVFDLPPPQAPR